MVFTAVRNDGQIPLSNKYREIARAITSISPIQSELFFHLQPHVLIVVWFVFFYA
jgi:hypothetical protein